MIFCVIGKMGKGKTMFATLYAIGYSQDYPQNKIYANYHLNLNNFIYTPYMFMSFSELQNCLIIVDDFYAMKNLETFTQIIANLSRKKDISIILTAQYYTMISKQIRELSNAIVFCNFDKKRNRLKIAFTDLDKSCSIKIVKEPTKKIKDVYDTNEVVKFASENEIVNEIKKASKTKADIEFNVMLYTKNKIQQKRLMNQLIKEKRVDTKS